MKKVNLLLLACLAFAASVVALPWPDDYDFAGSIYSASPDVPEAYEKQQGVAMSFVDEDIIMPETGDGAAFDAIYDMIGSEFEYELDKLREKTEKEIYDGVPVFKVAYTEDAFYLFVKYAHTDNSEISDGSNLEVMFCPYDKLEHDGEVEADKEGFLWLRYLELGGVKVNALNKESISTFKLGNYMGAIQQLGGLGVLEEDRVLAGSYYESFVELASCGTSTVTKLVLKLDFEALKCRTPLFLDEVPFTLDSWRAACEGKGISFEVKFTLDNEDERDTKRSYMWNNGNNNSYFNNAYAGYLKMEEAELHAISATSETEGGIVDVADKNNMTIAEAVAGTVITLTVSEVEDFRFVEWTAANTADLALLDDVKAPQVSFVMPKRDVAFVAVYASIIGNDNAEIKNMSVKSGFIVLNEAAKIVIFNSTGVLVASVDSASELPISSLPAGIYTAKSGSEVLKFAK